MNQSDLLDTQKIPPRDKPPFNSNIKQTPDKYAARPTEDESKAPTQKDPLMIKGKKHDPRTIFQRKELTDREREQIYLFYYDENLKLKANQTKLDQVNKELKTKLRALENEYVTAKRRSDGQADESEFEIIEQLKRENEELREQLKENKISSSNLKLGGNPKTLVKSVVKTSVTTGPKPGPEHLRLIDLLKLQLRKAETEIQALHGQLSVVQGKGPITDDVHDKNIKIATLQARFENLETAFNAQKAMLEKSKSMIEDVNKQLYNERKKIGDLEVQLRTAEMASGVARDLELQLDETRNEKRMLELKIKALAESPFLKDIEERSNNPLRLKEAEEQLAEYKMHFSQLKDKYIEREKQVIKMEAEHKNFMEDYLKVKEEKKRLEGMLAEREKNLNFLDEQLKLFNFGSERDKDEFLKALGAIKLRGEEPAWKKLEFIERLEEVDMNDPTSMAKEIHRLKLEKSELAAQLEKTQTLLHTHLDIEKEHQVINNAEVNKLQLQLKAANNRIEELVKLADFRAKNYKQMLLRSGAPFQNLEEERDDFSVITESDMHTGENVFDLLIKDCELDELVIRKVTGGRVIDMRQIQTVAAVDFYNHDTQHSGVVEGLKPDYNFQIAYKVSIDENLINHMENESLKIEIYASYGSELIFLGTCYAPYRELLIKNYDVQFGSSATVTISGIIYGQRKSDIVGVVRIKMRMRHPIHEELKWIKEKKDLISDYDFNIDLALEPNSKIRKLIVQIEKATGVQAAASFVFYKLYNLKDTVTQTVKGNDPVYSFLTTHDLAVNDNVTKYINTETLEFVIFDDSVPLYDRYEDYDEKNPNLKDIIGKARVRLADLGTKGILDVPIPIINLGGREIGKLHFKVYWYDYETKETIQDSGKLTDLWEENLTKNIAKTLLNKGQSLDTSFPMFDADGDNLISYDEFKWGVLRIFRVNVPENEIALYWSRLPLKNDKLDKIGFEYKFGPYMVSIIAKQEEEQRKEAEMKKDPKAADIAKINEELKQKIRAEAYNLFIRQLAQYARSAEVPIDFVLGKFDNVLGYITKSELKANLIQMSIDMSEPQINELFEYFDLNQQGKVHILEFKALVKPDLLKEYQLQSKPLTAEEKKEIINNISKFIFDYLRKHNITIVQFCKKMDFRLDGNITKTDFELFFKDLDVKIETRETDAFFQELDPQKKGKIALSDFSKMIKPYLKERPIVTKTIQDSLRALAIYIKRNRMDAHQFFVQFDTDRSGFLDRNEMRAALLMANCLPSQLEVTNLLNHLDYGDDGRVSMKEFVDIIEPYVEKVDLKKIPIPVTEEKLDDLKKKIATIVKSHKDDLLQAFDILQSEPGFIAVDDFKKALIGLEIGFMPSDIDIIIDHLAVFKGEFIDFDQFLIIGPKEPSDTIEQIRQSGYENALKKSKTGENIFRRMNKALIDAKMTPMEAFKVFDKNGDGTISIQEFRNAFYGMKIGLTEDEISDVIAYIDKKKDGNVNYNDFLSALKM